METIHLKTSDFEIANVVFNFKFNFSREVMRYLLLKEKLTMKRGKDMLMQAFSNFYESNQNFQTTSVTTNQVPDPFLFPLTYNPADPRFTELQVNEYNAMVENVLKSLPDSRTKISGLKFRITPGYPMVFEVSYQNKKIFHQKIYNSRLDFLNKDTLFLKSGNKELELRMLAALFRYELLGFLNNSSAAVTPKTYAALAKKGYSVELFASFYNCYMKHYFGLFYDLEHPFGCLGNLFTAQLNYGKFVCNPPFEVRTMNRMVNFLKRQMDLSHTNSLFVYIIVPVWYRKDREKLGKIQTYSEKSEFHKELLEPYIVNDEIILQKDYKFYIYLTGKYENLCDVNNFTISKLKKSIL